MASKLPTLLTEKEFAALVGFGQEKLRVARKRGRVIPAPQLVGGYVWVYSRDAKIMRKGLDIDDPFVASLPAEFIAEEVYKDESRLPPKVERPGGPGYMPKKVRLWNYDALTAGLPVRHIEEVTGVHHNTLAKIKDGKPVRAVTALKIARGLGVPVESLLRR